MVVTHKRDRQISTLATKLQHLIRRTDGRTDGRISNICGSGLLIRDFSVHFAHKGKTYRSSFEKRRVFHGSEHLRHSGKRMLEIRGCRKVENSEFHELIHGVERRIEKFLIAVDKATIHGRDGHRNTGVIERKSVALGGHHPWFLRVRVCRTA